ncbi:hypothetical protein ACHHV8_25845 [Paenibacillus sp. TAB 01]|uniref:hypothetical protein n=1 Tax=Paenibacillus sp. TAB 01 TaxID=3368988 RepID=UPI00375372A9
MWVVIGIFIAASGIIAIDVPYLRSQGLRKELWVFSFLLLIGVGLNLALFVLHWAIPNPLDLIIFVYKPVSRLVFGLLT